MTDESLASDTTRGLVERLERVRTQLERDQAESVPENEPYLGSTSRLKRGVKRGVFRLGRPATRRYDRLAAEAVAVSVELAKGLAATEADIERLQGEIDRLSRALQMARSSDGGFAPGETAGGPTVPDDYYWAFEARMRGSSSSVLERLRQYERFAVPLRDSAADATNGPPLWLDLGCGLGDFCELLMEWGWRVQGVDSSTGAVDACAAKGIDATLADVGEYVRARRGEAPAAVSAIQLIEHVPRERWIDLIQSVHDVLEPGGAMLIETINGLNPSAVSRYFLADVTHTWPGHPETIALMAKHAGFEEVEIVFLNPDQQGNAQDFAIWAVKPEATDP